LRSTSANSADAFFELCHAHGLSGTHQRLVIWSVLRDMAGHPSPEAVYERVREEIPSISLATVYKNLKLFVQHGLLREVSLHHGSVRIETRQEQHHHLVCVRCRSITDIDEAEFEPVRLKKASPAGFRVHRYSIEVQGLCKSCAER
jgi:Fur family peroxide stress response transcriptional regulator